MVNINRKNTAVNTDYVAKKLSENLQVKKLRIMFVPESKNPKKAT
jgi:hypothetical protein